MKKRIWAWILTGLMLLGLPALRTRGAEEAVRFEIEAPAETGSNNSFKVTVKMHVPAGVQLHGIQLKLTLPDRVFGLAESWTDGDFTARYGTATVQANPLGQAVFLWNSSTNPVQPGSYVLFRANVRLLDRAVTNSEYGIALTAEDLFQLELDENGVYVNTKRLSYTTFPASVFVGRRLTVTPGQVQLYPGDTLPRAQMVANKPIRDFFVIDESVLRYRPESDCFEALTPGSCPIVFIGENQEQTTVLVTVKEKPTVPISLTSAKFSVTGSHICKIPAGTTVEELLAGLLEGSYVTICRTDGTVANAREQVGTGFCVQLPGGQVWQTVVTGDVNGDGKITAADYVNVKFAVLGKQSLAGSYGLAADVNGDGRVTAADYVNIKFGVLGKIQITPR